jgi:hypothetical protein
MVNYPRLPLLIALCVCTSSCLTVWRGFDFYAANSIGVPNIETSGVYLVEADSYFNEKSSQFFEQSDSHNTYDNHTYLTFLYDDHTYGSTSLLVPLDSVISNSNGYYNEYVEDLNKFISSIHWGEYKIIGDSIHMQGVSRRFGTYLFYSSWVTEAKGVVHDDSSFTITSSAYYAPNLLF